MTPEQLDKAVEVLLEQLRNLPKEKHQSILDSHRMQEPEVSARAESILAQRSHDPAPDCANAATASDHADEEIPGMMIGHYKLLQKLGKGGMGVVWMAEQTEPVSRRVAVKIIKAHLHSDQVLARFEAERQALAMMDHPNIAKVLDAGTTSAGRPYFVMELVKGIAFTKYCDQEHLTPAERLALFIPVCNAVQHAHQKGIIHRDLKPSNVLIALYDGKPVPKVIDFGVAKATTQKLTERTMFTEVGQIIGTLEYMAPEQAEMNNLDIDTRADIYSLGVMLYELLTGTLPFLAKQLRGEAFLEMLRLIREVEPQKPSTKLSGSDQLPAIAAKRKLEPKRLSRFVKGDLDWIVMKCLEKERARRYETANQLGQELQRFLTDEPVQAGPPSVGYRTRKFLRRNKGPVAAVCLVILALIGGVIGTSVGLMMADKALAAVVAERHRAEGNEARANKAAEDANKAAAAAKSATAQAEKARSEAEEAAARERKATATAKGHSQRMARANDMLRSILVALSNSSAQEKGAPHYFEQLHQKLDKLLKTLDLSLIDDADTVGHLQLFLGNALYSAGNTKRAIEFLTGARASLEKSLGADHPDTLNAMNNLALAYHAGDQLDKALPLYQETLERMSKRLGTDDADTLTTMNNLALAYLDAGRSAKDAELSAKALKLLEETLAKRKAKFGADHPDTIRSMNNLALAKQGDAPGPLQQKSIDRALAFLSTANCGRDVLGFVHAGASYKGHVFQRRVSVKNKPGDFALIYRFSWENDGISDVAFLCDGAGVVYDVQATFTNGILQQPFSVANLTINLLGKALLDSYRDQMQPEEIQRAQQFIDNANARGLLAMSLRLRQMNEKGAGKT